MAKAKRKSANAKQMKPTDFLGWMIGYAEQVLDESLTLDVSAEIRVEFRDETFGEFVCSAPEFTAVPTDSDLIDKDEDYIRAKLRSVALGLVTEYYGAEFLDELKPYANDTGKFISFFEQEEWHKAVSDLGMEWGEWDEDGEPPVPETLNEVIAQNAINNLAEKVEEESQTDEEESIPDEELVMGLAEETGIEYPEIPADIDSSVADFMSEIEKPHVHDENCMHEVPVVAHTHDAVPWATLAAIEKHKNAISENESPVLALANGVEELVDNGGVQTQRGLLDAILILIEAKPAEALRIVASWEKLN